MMLIMFSNGSTLKCTQYHKFFIQKNNEVIVKPASELFIGDQLVGVTYPIIDNSDNRSNFDLKTKINHLQQLIDQFQIINDDEGHLAISILAIQIKHI